MLYELFSNLRNLDQLIAWAGYGGMTVIIFAETGLVVTPFLPGDSLLFVAGAVAAVGAMDVNKLVIAARRKV